VKNHPGVGWFFVLGENKKRKRETQGKRENKGGKVKEDTFHSYIMHGNNFGSRLM
jgi:hypothetical protein